MKATTKRIITITSCLIAAGLLLLAAGLVMGGSSIKHWPSAIGQALSGNAKSYAFDSGENAESFQTISLEAVRADIIVKRGDSFSFRYEFKNTHYEPEYRLENGTLLIRESMHSYGISWPWSLNYSGLIVVTIPEGARINRVSCDNVSGAVEIESLIADSVSINGVSGGVELSAVTAERLTVETVSGAINAKHANAGGLDLETVSGSITYDGESSGNVNTSSVSGRISLNGKLLGDITISQVSGSVNFQSSEPAAVYSGEFSSISGRLRINGEDRGKSYRLEGSGNALNIDTVSGGAVVSFGA